MSVVEIFQQARYFDYRQEELVGDLQLQWVRLDSMALSLMPFGAAVLTVLAGQD